MRSEISTEAVLAALEGPRKNFLSAVADLVGELGRLLVQDRDSEQGRAERSAATLGAFGSGRVDARRFAALVSDRPVLPPAALEAIGRARAVLSGIVTGGPEPFLVVVRPGEDVAAAVGRALARLGRVFGAARVAALARAGAYRSSEHAALLDALPFARWNRSERGLAPPLVVRVEGPRLRLAGLADMLEGGVKFVVLAPEAEGPAPLALLVTPGVFVAQGSSLDLLDRLCATAAPGIVAILAEKSAHFVHDPKRGRTLGDRLTVDRLPGTTTEEARSPQDFRACEEHAQLALLVAAASAGSASPPAEPADALRGDPAGLLASWLLREASLPQPAEAHSGAV
jgi:hypothetical protein